jgi:mono/diheme cytochrome c family protein
MPRRGAGSEQIEKSNMKRLILLGVIIGVGSALTVSAGDAKATWDSTCAKCHGADGKGQTKIGEKLGIKDFTDPKVQSELTDDAAFKAIKEGVKKDGRTRMKAFAELSDEEIKALVQYVRAFKH